ncbi:glycosyltransferase family 39 protein [uncultured Clostridium sp.]|uniref:ArnT family glycosyltransferase n=1 Tax=uncultured Clostridium sp. TaxID=59620 RepID=UPI0028E41DE6|nr:glycosyltransferase family 39 protein [uncultured Clostridium sp.]
MRKEEMMIHVFKEDKKIKLGLILVEILFIVIASISSFKYGNSTLLGSLEQFDNDDVKYIRSAWNLVQSGIFSYENVSKSTAYIMPGLTFILSPFVILFGKFQAIMAFRIFQIALQAGSLNLIFLIGRKIFNKKAALAACIIDSIYIVEIYAGNLILMEVTFKFIFLLLVYVSILALETKKKKHYVQAGIVWSLGCLFKPTIAAYPIIIFIVWIKNRYKVKEMVKYASIVICIFCIIMSPWWIRNYKDFNMFIPFTKSTGNPFLQGTFINYDQSNGWGVEYRHSENFIQSNEYEIEAGMERLEKYGVQEPLKFIYWYTIGKTLYFWYEPFYWYEILGITYKWAFLEHYLILITACISIINTVRLQKWNLGKQVIALSIIVMNLVYLPYYTYSRYAYPLMPLVIIFSGDYMCKFVSLKAGSKKWKRSNQY